MPILTFDVESYTVHAIQSGITTRGAYRGLTLTSPALAHGIRSRATVYFFPIPPPNTLGSVSNVDQPNYDGLTAYAYCRKTDFADWYDMLRNERPMKFSCSYDGPDFDPSKSNRRLHYVELYTELEPPGEGPEGILSLTLSADVLSTLRGDTT